MQPFVETQHFRQWWLWALLGGVFLVTVMPLVSSEASHNSFSWFGPVVALLIGALFYLWRLDTRLDAEGIHYRVFPILPWRTITWTAVKSATVTQYGFVGYGIRLGFDGYWIYNVAGNKGIRIVRTNGSKLTIGTQRPNDVMTFLNKQAVV
ncbi:hypothetical protein GCM10028807_42900 [Spirosoma daeguense]